MGKMGFQTQPASHPSFCFLRSAHCATVLTVGLLVLISWLRPGVGGARAGALHIRPPATIWGLVTPLLRDSQPPTGSLLQGCFREADMIYITKADQIMQCHFDDINRLVMEKVYLIKKKKKSSSWVKVRCFIPKSARLCLGDTCD